MEHEDNAHWWLAKDNKGDKTGKEGHTKSRPTDGSKIEGGGGVWNRREKDERHSQQQC